MTDDGIPRKLPPRTGRHICTNCLREVGPDEYFGHDLICADCAEQEGYPLASTDEVGAVASVTNPRAPNPADTRSDRAANDGN